MGIWHNLEGGLAQASREAGTAEWLSNSAAIANARKQRETTGILLYCWWNVWKERNRCVFKSIQKSAFQLALFAKEEIDLYKLAFRAEMSQ
jgi:hypothetical protein